MNSFTLTAIGSLTRDPDMSSKGDKLYTRFQLVGNDYAGRSEEGGAREITTSVQFVAFGALAEAIALNARKGDQLIVDAQMRADNWTDALGEKKFGYAFIAQGFRLAHREKSSAMNWPSGVPAAHDSKRPGSRYPSRGSQKPRSNSNS